MPCPVHPTTPDTLPNRVVLAQPLVASCKSLPSWLDGFEKQGERELFVREVYEEEREREKERERERDVRGREMTFTV